MRASLVLLLSLGCSEATGPAVPYSLNTRPTLPFPTDELLRDGADSPTGLSFTLTEQGLNLGDADEALFLFGPDFAQALTRTDGWSTLGPVFLELPQPVDEASLAEHLWLVDLEAGARVPVDVKLLGGKTEYGRPVHWASARSPLPLRPGAPHAVALARGVRATTGEALAPSPLFAALMDEEPAEGDPARVERARARVAALLPGLERAGLARDDVLVADRFTTQSFTPHARALAHGYREAALAALDLDLDDDGQDERFPSPAADPRWSVPSGEAFPHVELTLRFRAEVPSFRAEPAGPLGADHHPAGERRRTTVEGLLILPKGPGPFPLVRYQHGLGDQKESVWRYAEGFAAIGVAVVAFDAPLHGARTDRPGNAGTNFINVVAPSLVVDNFREAEAEGAYLARLIDQLAALDLRGDGSRPLDASRLLWVGHSLGAILAVPSLALEPRYQGAVLIVGGGSLLEFFDRVLGGFELDAFPAELFVTVAQTALDRGDPTNFAPLVADRQLLLLQAMQDDTIPAKATEALGRALALPQVSPVYTAVPGVQSASGPLAGRGWLQFDDATHSLTYEPGAHPAAHQAARATLFHFVETWARSGVGEVRR